MYGILVGILSDIMFGVLIGILFIILFGILCIILFHTLLCNQSGELLGIFLRVLFTNTFYNVFI